MPHAVIHTDGSCAGRSALGGWAAVIRLVRDDGTFNEPVVLSGSVPQTTNNRMEMTAAIEALKAYPQGAATIVTDSQYLIRGITEWVRPWKSRGWKNAEGRRVPNRDLWRELDALTAGREITWTWVKAHVGHAENDEVDALARRAVMAHESLQSIGRRSR